MLKRGTPPIRLYFQISQRRTQTSPLLMSRCTYRRHLVISLSSAVSSSLMSPWFVPILPCEFCYSLKQMSGSARCETGHLAKSGTESHAGLSPSVLGCLLVHNLSLIPLWNRQHFRREPDVGKRATRIKFQTNNELSYYKNNLVTLNTLRQWDKRAVAQPGRYSNNLCKTMSPTRFILHSRNWGFELCEGKLISKFKVFLQAI